MRNAVKLMLLSDLQPPSVQQSPAALLFSHVNWQSEDVLVYSLGGNVFVRIIPHALRKTFPLHPQTSPPSHAPPAHALHLPFSVRSRSASKSLPRLTRSMSPSRAPTQAIDTRLAGPGAVTIPGDGSVGVGRVRKYNRKYNRSKCNDCGGGSICEHVWVWSSSCSSSSSSSSSYSSSCSCHTAAASAAACFYVLLYIYK